MLEHGYTVAKSCANSPLESWGCEYREGVVFGFFFEIDSFFRKSHVEEDLACISSSATADFSTLRWIIPVLYVIKLLDWSSTVSHSTITVSHYVLST